MTPIEQQTAHLALPLPHPDNDLGDDVFRLRDALTRIDGAVYALRALVVSDDVNLDTVQEVVAVLKQAQGDIGDITALLATKASVASLDALSTSTSQALASKADKTELTQLSVGMDQDLALKADRSELPAAARLAPAIAGAVDAGKVVQVKPDGSGFQLGPGLSAAQIVSYSTL